MAACYTWRESELNIVWTAFKKLDTDNDGVISVEEFSNLLLSGDDDDGLRTRLVQKRGVSRESLVIEIQKLITQIDRNGDGQIDWDEFLDYMRGAEYTGGLQIRSP